jgi:hypothetical protein
MHIVYKHTSPSGKSYIGITTFSIEKRFEQHICEFCDKEISTPMYKRWHGMKCKENK